MCRWGILGSHQMVLQVQDHILGLQTLCHCACSPFATGRCCEGTTSHPGSGVAESYQSEGGCMWEVYFPAEFLVWESSATQHNALHPSFCQMLGTATCQKSLAERLPLLEKACTTGWGYTSSQNLALFRHWPNLQKPLLPCGGRRSP